MNKNLNNFVITLDLDWAPDEVLKYTLNLLKSFNIPATLFMTNKSLLSLEGYEVGIHPSFTSLNFSKHISPLIKYFPDAIGTRSHSLFYTERLREVYPQFQLKYQSNMMLYKQKNIKPFLMSQEVMEIPIFWMDTFALYLEKNSGIDIKKIDLKSKGLKVFDFHPIHIYLNTYSLEHYRSAKEHYQNPLRLKKFRNKKYFGVRDFFVQLLEKIIMDKSPISFMSELVSI